MAFECAEQRGLPEPKSGDDGEASVATKDPEVSLPISDSPRCTLKQVYSLRGARATNTAVRDFWIACRGAEFAYA